MENNINLDDPRVLLDMINNVSAAKEALALHPSVDIQLYFDVGLDDFPVFTIQREQLEATVMEFNRTIVGLEKGSLEMANLTAIAQVELVGGGSRAAFLRELLETVFGIGEVLRAFHQDFVYALAVGDSSAERSPQFTVPSVNRSLMIRTPAVATSTTTKLALLQ